jgi:hypothetical protein
MKLTKEYRSKIIERCVAARFATAENAYAAARTALADALYEHAFGKAEVIAKELPPEWISGMRTLYISCDGFKGQYNSATDKPGNDFKLSRERLKPAIITTQFSIDDHHPLYSQAQAIVEMFNAIKTGKETLTHQLTSLLYSVTTREKLLEVWPEGEPYFPPVVQQASVPIPYELTLSINRMMGIGEVEAIAQ